MTTETVDPQSGPRRDPLRRLRRRIEQAQDPSADPAPAGEFQSDDDDPLEALQRRIDRAADPSTLREPAEAAPPPLSDLLAAFDHARALLEEPVGYLREADTEDPIERMQRQLDREIEKIGRRENIDLPREAGPEPTDSSIGRSRPSASSADGSAAVGREVLRMLESQPLPGEVRAEAVQRLAGAIESGDREELRAVLRLLIQR